VGEGQESASGAGDDPFAELRAAGFFDDAPREPSAEERAAMAARQARQRDLQRRLIEEAAHERRLAERDRRQRRKVSRVLGSTSSSGTSRYRNLIAPAVVIALIGTLYWVSNRQGLEVAIPGAPPQMQRPPDYPPIDESVADAPLGTPPPAPAEGGAFEFLHTQQTSGAPVTWDPCRPIRYVVNPAGAPPGSDVLLDEAIARTSAATGLQFVNEGPTDETWSRDRDPYLPELYGEKWAPVLITWSTQEQVPGLAGYIAGQAGPVAVSAPNQPRQTMVHVSGTVVLDASDLGAILGQPGGPERVRAVIQHELGHLVGLDHVADVTQLMYSEGNELQSGDWASGDLAGLHQLGSGPCAPTV
jgi:hypothetical protein